MKNLLEQFSGRAYSYSLWEILVPATDNDGKEIPIKVHQEWDGNVRLMTRGLTVMRSVKGQWTSPEGEVYVDKVIPVRIAVDDWSVIDSIVDMTAEHYKQKAIMYYRLTDEVKIKEFD